MADNLWYFAKCIAALVIIATGIPYLIKFVYLTIKFVIDVTKIFKDHLKDKKEQKEIDKKVKLAADAAIADIERGNNE